jgi:hypothetical protein
VRIFGNFVTLELGSRSQFYHHELPRERWKNTTNSLERFSKQEYFLNTRQRCICDVVFVNAADVELTPGVNFTKPFRT